MKRTSVCITFLIYFWQKLLVCLQIILKEREEKKRLRLLDEDVDVDVNPNPPASLVGAVTSRFEQNNNISSQDFEQEVLTCEEGELEDSIGDVDSLGK